MLVCRGRWAGERKRWFPLVSKVPIGPPAPQKLSWSLLGLAAIVSSLERAGDIHWLPLRLFTGDLVTVKHAFAIPPWARSDMFLRDGWGEEVHVPPETAEADRKVRLMTMGSELNKTLFLTHSKFAMKFTGDLRQVFFPMQILCSHRKRIILLISNFVLFFRNILEMPHKIHFQLL